MYQTALRLLFATLACCTLFVAGTACDEDDGGSDTSIIRKQNPPIGADQEVLGACQQACEAMTSATVCKDAHLRSDADACKASCAEQVASVSKTCRDEALLAYGCQAAAKWSCGGSSVAVLVDMACAGEIDIYRDCILGS
jgi:hypothetical protein